MLITACSFYLIFEAVAFGILGVTTEWALSFILLPIEKKCFHPHYRAPFASY